MHLVFKKFCKSTWVLGLLGLLLSCQDTIPNRSTITQSSNANEPIVCPDDKDPVMKDGVITECKDKEFKRPNDAIFWKTDFCACNNGKPVSYGNCTSFCSTKNTNGAETLFANFTVGDEISLSPLGSVYGWCNQVLPTDKENPRCEIEAKDDEGDISIIPVSVSANTNSLTANIQTYVDYDKTYILTLVEKTSGARSNSVQFIKFSVDLLSPILGPLKISPITQYACLVRAYLVDDSTGDNFYESAYRLHFYFIPRMPPKPVPPNFPQLICHDIFNPLYGSIDMEIYPRFEQDPDIFNLWDLTDPRFYDINVNGKEDINDLIIQKTKTYGGSLPGTSSFFSELKWANYPTFSSDSSKSDSSNLKLGYYMKPWIDSSTFKSYCLNSTHYNSNNPLYKALRDIIGVDTEGLYIAEKSPETISNSSGELTTGYPDYLFISESDVKSVWFYLKNGVPTVPTDENIGNNAIYFYHPLNKASPFVRTTSQKIYRVKGASELTTSSVSGGSGSSTSGLQTTYTPHDRKIGCIPKF